MTTSSNKTIADLNSDCICEILSYFALADLKNISEVSKSFFDQTKLPITKNCKLHFKKPLNYWELKLLKGFQRNYENISFEGETEDDWRNANELEVIQQLKKINFDSIKSIEMELYNIGMLQEIKCLYPSLKTFNFFYNSRHVADEQQVLETCIINNHKAKDFITKATIYEITDFEMCLNNLENMPNLQELTLFNGIRDATTNRLVRFSWLKKLKILNIWPPCINPIDSLPYESIKTFVLKNIEEITCALSVNSVIKILEFLLSGKFCKKLKLVNFFMSDVNGNVYDFLERNIKGFKMKDFHLGSGNSYSNSLELKFDSDKIHCTYYYRK